MRFSRGHRVPIMAAIVAAAIMGLAPAPLQSAAAATADAATNQNSCANLPISSQLFVATSCHTTANGVIAAGTNPAVAGSAVLGIFDNTTRTLDTFDGQGTLVLDAVSSTSVCIALGAKTADLDAATGAPTPAAQSACGNAQSLEVSERSVASLDSPATTTSTAKRNATAANVSPDTLIAASYSYYVVSANVSKCTATATSACPLYEYGATESVPTGGGLVVLAFGAPCQNPSTHVSGVETFYQPMCVPDATVLVMLNRFVAGYESTHNATTPKTVIAAGVSNSENGIPGDAQSASEMATIGHDWGTNVVTPAQAATHGDAAPVTIWGGLDAEESSAKASDGTQEWMQPSRTLPFVDSFASAEGHTTTKPACGAGTAGMLADFGDAVYLREGDYPPDPTLAISPQGGWTADTIYHAAWGSPVACAVPEVYYAINAYEWQSLSSYEQSKSQTAITFSGPMSENGYCSSPNNCTDTSRASYNDLASATGQTPPFLTTIEWQSLVTPASLNALAATQTTTEFQVSWQLASGLSRASYDVYVQDNNGNWLTWMPNTTASIGTFDGWPGHTYGFFVRTLANGYDSGAPHAASVTTTIAAGATQIEPFAGLYASDAYGAVRAASSPPVQISAYWQGWPIARGSAEEASGHGGYVVDGFGGVHNFGDTQPIHVPAANYFSNRDIMRGIAVLPDGTGGYTLDAYGGIHPFGTATPVTGTGYWPGWDIARGITLLPSGTGGYVLDGWGGVHPFGTAHAVTLSAYWSGWDIARSVVVDASGTGGYVLDGFGGVHQFGSATAPTPTPTYWAGWDIARAVVLVPGSDTEGWTVDGYGGFHAFGGAPAVNAYVYVPTNVIRAASSGA